jgi:hypothetical protein
LPICKGIKEKYDHFEKLLLKMDKMNPSQLIDKQIAELGDWRGELLARIRHLIHAAAPDITEEWKWGTAVYTQKGLICAASSFKDHAKLNFFKGAHLDDPKGLFNAGLEAKEIRSIDLHQGDRLQEAALQNLIRAAVAFNLSREGK